MLSSALNTCAWCREERLGGQGGLTKHWQGCGKCQGEGVAKSSDPSQILWDTCHSPQCFYFNTTLKIWGFLCRRQEPEKSITSVVSSPSLDGFLLNHTLLDPRDHLAPPFHFRDGEVEIQREELLPKVTLRTRTQILYFLFCFSFYHTASQFQGGSFRLYNLQETGPVALAFFFYWISTDFRLYQVIQHSVAFRLVLERLPYTQGRAWDEESEDFV